MPHNLAPSSQTSKLFSHNYPVVYRSHIPIHTISYYIYWLYVYTCTDPSLQCAARYNLHIISGARERHQGTGRDVLWPRGGLQLHPQRPSMYKWFLKINCTCVSHCVSTKCIKGSPSVEQGLPLPQATRGVDQGPHWKSGAVFYVGHHHPPSGALLAVWIHFSNGISHCCATDCS